MMFIEFGRTLRDESEGDHGSLNPFRPLKISFEPGQTQVSEYHISSIGSSDPLNHM